MADTALTAASIVQKWDSAFLAEYVRDSRFRPYMGAAPGKGVANANPLMPILVKTELTTAGKIINIPLIGRLKGDGKQGNATLVGQEEALGNWNHQVNVHFNRNAVSIPESDEHWTEMDLRHAAKMMLQTWAAESLRDDIIIALMSPNGNSYINSLPATTATGTVMTPAEWIIDLDYTGTAADAWFVANIDRIQFGADPLHHVGTSTDFSATVVKLTDGTDAMTANVLRHAKHRAKMADPHIRPIRVNNDKGREYYVVFMSTDDFNNIKADEEVGLVNRDARARGVDDHPLFQDGDLIFDGLILREVPEIPYAGPVGAGPADIVSQSFLCGAQALSVAWGMKPQSRKAKEDDYGHFNRIGITECRGVSKNFFNGKQHGVVSIFCTAAPNS